MRRRPTTVELLWGLALLFAAGLATGFGTTRKSESPTIVAVASARVPQHAPTVDLDLAALNRAATQEIAEHLFAAPPPPAPLQAPAPAPVAPAVAAPPPAPRAPPLPFRYLGRLIDGDRTSAFVASGSQSLSLKAGDVIDNHHYRVERIADDALEFVYLPLDERQTLTLGARP